MTKFISRNALPSLERGTSVTLDEPDVKVYIVVSLTHQLAFFGFASENYPPRIARKVLKRSLDLFIEQKGDSWLSLSKDSKIEVPGIKKLFS